MIAVQCVCQLKIVGVLCFTLHPLHSSRIDGGVKGWGGRWFNPLVNVSGS